MMRHGATSQQVCTILVSFWKVVLHMSRTSHSPQLHNKGDRLLLGRELMVYQAFYPSRNFPKARSWQVVPHNGAMPPPPHDASPLLAPLG